MKELIEDWFKKAIYFKKNAKQAKENKLYDVVCFSAHQAVELLLKGIIENNGGGASPFTHSLIELHEEIITLNLRKFPEEIVKCLEILTKFYIDGKYPDSCTEEEALNALNCMEEVFKYTNRFLLENKNTE
ncbi:MAG: HEPN domain-containing protein [Asgard group archaeon]|nr:HEPN domain-containing protein [Asgard group archaeon]